ncbi:MAG TPA: sodium:solute symporter family protein [Bryobacteraceae bacterium]|nr:sodium:solute symporter family protein [Bryobacteraceae bacterium]
MLCRCARLIAVAAAGRGGLIAAPPVKASRLLVLARADIIVICLYFAVVLGIGAILKRRVHASNDFFFAGKGVGSWVAGLSFVAANLGTLELLGWSASAYEYGMLATHWYWIGAVPAMLFLGVVMIPFYYVSKARSVPGYLKLRYGESSRLLAAISFAVMTILMSGINMFSMALVMKVIVGWDIQFSILVSTATVAVYVALGGLLSAIVNEVVQFLLIWAGTALIPIYGLIETGGWKGMLARIAARFPGQDYLHMWRNMGSAAHNPMGVHWTGMVIGLGMIGAFGYWTTDFLVVQRVLAARDLRSAKMATVIGAAFKMLLPAIIILPGLLGLAVLPGKLMGESQALATGGHSYNEVMPLMMARYLRPGLLGVGVTALIAGFMSGMAGNVSAFATVWTYDIYRPVFRPDAGDRTCLRMGRWCTVLGLVASIGAAYAVMQFASIMDYVQALFGFFIIPLFGTVILGMLWKRATPAGGFWGLLCGTLASIALWLWVRFDPSALGVLALSSKAKPMAENLYRFIWSWLVCMLVTVAVSLFTKPKPVYELKGLVWGVSELPRGGALPFYRQPLFFAGVVAAAFLFLNLYFW